jgi:hypothetical protein
VIVNLVFAQCWRIEVGCAIKWMGGEGWSEEVYEGVVLGAERKEDRGRRTVKWSFAVSRAGLKECDVLLDLLEEFK